MYGLPTTSRDDKPDMAPNKEVLYSIFLHYSISKPASFTNKDKTTRRDITDMCASLQNSAPRNHEITFTLIGQNFYAKK